LAPTVPTSDRLVRWPLYSGIAILAITGIIWGMPIFIGFALIPLIFLILGVVMGLLGAVIWCGSIALFRRQWRRALSVVAFPLMVALTIPSADMARSARDELRFLIHKSGYEAQVAAAKAKGQHHVSVDDWSIFFNANSFVVWDEYDEPDEPGFKSYQSFGGHFYLIGD
jgi:hypothetical protein